MTKKSWEYPYNPVFFILSDGKSLEILPKHTGGTFISDSLLWIYMFQHHYQIYNFSIDYKVNLSKISSAAHENL